MKPHARDRRRGAALCLAAALALILLPAAAFASQKQQSIMQEDAFLHSPARDAILDDMKALGVDRVRVTVFWDRVAPEPDSRSRPEFRGGRHPSNPAAYDPDKWEVYDDIFREAQERDIAVYVTIAPPGPLWAMDRPRGVDADTAERLKRIWNPDPEDYGDFVKAVGTRYTGSYECPPDASADCLGREVPPRIRFYSVSNEPNHDIGLAPQWVCRPDHEPCNPKDSGDWIIRSPRIYRNLVDAGVQGLVESGHANDTILVGETAPRGPSRTSDRARGPERPIQPLEFIRELYCLNGNYTFYTGDAARERGCPRTSAGRANFRADHPGLFRKDGFPHHPYSLLTGPRIPESERDNISLVDLPRLARELDLVRGKHGDNTQVPIWVSEYAYQTNPPDPTIAGIPWSLHTAWLSEADYITYNNPRVVSTAQFLLVDDVPLTQFPANDPRRWAAFQSGLRLRDGRAKTAYTYYFKRSIHVIPPRSGTDEDISIFGQLRSADNGEDLRVRVELKRPGGDYEPIRGPLTVKDRRGFFLDHEVPARDGRYRLVWKSPASGRYVLKTRSIEVSAG